MHPLPMRTFGLKQVLLVSTLLTTSSACFQASAATVSTITGRAVGDFCCVMDDKGQIDYGTAGPNGTIVSANGSSQFSITNNDDGSLATSPPPPQTTKLTWGTASNASNGTVNYFEFDGNGSNAGSSVGTTEAGQLFNLGTFDYYNAATRQDKVSQVSFNLNMTAFGSVSTEMFPTLKFDIGIINTPDSSNPVTSQDTAFIKGASVLDANGNSIMSLIDANGNPVAMDFTLDGSVFQFMLAGFAVRDPSSGLPYTDSSGNFIFSNSTSARENSLTTAGIYATITSLSEVPVPGALWLFGSGILGMVYAGRRRKMI